MPQLAGMGRLDARGRQRSPSKFARAGDTRATPTARRHVSFGTVTYVEPPVLDTPDMDDAFAIAAAPCGGMRADPRLDTEDSDPDTDPQLCRWLNIREGKKFRKSLAPRTDSQSVPDVQPRSSCLWQRRIAGQALAVHVDIAGV